MTTEKADEIVSGYKYGWHDPEFKPINEVKKGLDADVVAQISEIKNEPQWMRDFRLKSLDHFESKPMPYGAFWGGSIENYDLDFNDIYYYVKATDQDATSWDDVPEYIKDTFDKLGIPEAERQFLAGAGAQYDSEVVYHNIREDLEKQGVLFLGMDQGLEEYPEIVQEYFGTVIPSGDNRFSALNSAVWSGGSFIYVPPGVHVDVPLQAYFRINTENMGQFERTLIIADEGSYVHYVEGCTAPIYSTASLHSRRGRDRRQEGRPRPLLDDPELVEQRLQPRHQARRRARGRGDGVGRRQPRLQAHHEVPVRLPDGRARPRRDPLARLRRRRPAPGRRRQGRPRRPEHHLGDRVEVGSQGCRPQLLPRPAQGPRRRRELQLDRPLRRAAARRALPLGHLPDDGGRRGAREHRPRGLGLASSVKSSSSTSCRRGINEEDAAKMVVNGFVEPIVKELPMEYAIELNRLIELQMEGSIG